MTTPFSKVSSLLSRLWRRTPDQVIRVQGSGRPASSGWRRVRRRSRRRVRGLEVEGHRRLLLQHP